MLCKMWGWGGGVMTSLNSHTCLMLCKVWCWGGGIVTSLTSHTCVMLRKMWGWGWGKKNRDGTSAEVHRLDRRYVAFM